jgi:hypothetical protein
MAAGYQDQFLEQGTTFTTELTLNDANGTPYDLNGFTVSSKAKTSYYTNTIALNFNASISDANNGVITLSANSAVTANVSSRQKLVYDVVITDVATNLKTRVLEGQIFVSPAVTK